jgi:hypothetical protein
VFSLSPIDAFKEAFIVWRADIESNSRVEPGGSADTYFSVPVSTSGIGRELEQTGTTTWDLIKRFSYMPHHYYPSNGFTHYAAKNLVVAFMVYDERWGRCGFSGRAVSFTDPASSRRRVQAAFALNQTHEFLHALARLSDEYYDRNHSPISDLTLREESKYVSNVVSSPECETLPWKHLLHGGAFNPGVEQLVGAFGTNGRYHSEFKCFMNGAHHNADLYGGNDNLRVYDRLCNWCRELTTFRIYERVHILEDTEHSWETWKLSYREPFYRQFGFLVPDTVPQVNSEGEAWFMQCAQ